MTFFERSNRRLSASVFRFGIYNKSLLKALLTLASAINATPEISVNDVVADAAMDVFHIFLALTNAEKRRRAVAESPCVIKVSLSIQ